MSLKTFGIFTVLFFFSLTSFITAEAQNPPPTISVMDNNVIEGDGNGNTVAFLITLSQASDKVISIDYATADGTAVASADYVATSGTISIPAGQTATRINVPIISDITEEPTEAFTLNLSNPVNATIAKGQGTATIFDDDQPGISLQSNQNFINESISGLNIFVNRKGDLSSPHRSITRPATTAVQVRVTPQRVKHPRAAITRRR